MTKDHQQYASWNGERFLNWAGKIGASTQKVARLFLSRHQVEQQGYKSCMALLKLSDTYSVSRLEQACEKALSFTSLPSLKSIKIILNSGQVKEPRQIETTGGGFTRGMEYYQSGEEA
jgi:hypothetical protein